MNSVQVKSVVIGGGIPKICVPIIGKNVLEILAQAAELQNVPADLAEWRIDFFEKGTSIPDVLALLPEIAAALGELPLLATFRTAREGGERELTPRGYQDLLEAVCRSGYADLIDVELLSGDAVFCAVTDCAHANGVKVVGSNHDFAETPPRDELVSRLLRMQELNADLLKIAVMPQSARDVLELLSATEELHRCAERPVITMSMSKRGVLSRISGGLFGSAVTFGAASGASAPGQLPAEKLAELLQLLQPND